MFSPGTPFSTQPLSVHQPKWDFVKLFSQFYPYILEPSKEFSRLSVIINISQTELKFGFGMDSDVKDPRFRLSLL